MTIGENNLGFLDELVELSGKSKREIMKEMGFYYQKWDWWKHNPENFPVKYLVKVQKISGVNVKRFWQLCQKHFNDVV